MSEFFNNISQFISEKAEKVSRKTDEVLAVQGLKGQIRTAKREVEKHYYELGQAIYQKYAQGEAVSEDEKQHCDEVSRLNKLIEQYKEDIEAYKTRDDEFSEMWDEEEDYEDIVEEVTAEVVEETQE